MSDLITILNQLNDMFDAEAKKILDRINKGSAYTSDVFKDPVEFSVDIERPKSLRGYRGVYVFIMTENINMTLMGHTEVELTLNTYTDASEDFKRQEIALLDVLDSTKVG